MSHVLSTLFLSILTFAYDSDWKDLRFSFSCAGKTLLAKTLARFVNVPFVIADATTLTQVLSWNPIISS
jgi:hypothetical protein